MIQSGRLESNRRLVLGQAQAEAVQGYPAPPPARRLRAWEAHGPRGVRPVTTSRAATRRRTSRALDSRPAGPGAARPTLWRGPAARGRAAPACTSGLPGSTRPRYRSVVRATSMRRGPARGVPAPRVPGGRRRSAGRRRAAPPARPARRRRPAAGARRRARGCTLEVVSTSLYFYVSVCLRQADSRPLPPSVQVATRARTRRTSAAADGRGRPMRQPFATMLSSAWVPRRHATSA